MAAPVAIVFGGHFARGAFGYPDSILLAAAMALSAGVALAIWRDAGKILGAPMLWVAAALFAVPLAAALIQSASGSFDREYALMAALRLLALAACFVLACAIGVSERRFARFRLWIAVACLLFGLWALGRYALLAAELIPQAVFEPRDRLAATFLSPNSAALELALALVASLAVGLAELPDRATGGASRKLSFLGWLGLAAASVSAVDLCLTRSRSGIFLVLAAAVIGLLSLGGLSRKNLLLKGIPLAIAGAVLMLSTLIFRSGSGEDEIGQRLAIDRAHIAAALDQPLLGHGFGSFQQINRAQITEANFPRLFNIGALHNVYLQWLEQAGWIATGAMVLAVAWVLSQIAREAGRGRRPSAYWLRAGLAAAFIAFGQGLLDLGLEHYSIVLMLTMMLGVGFGICRRRDIRAKANPDQAAAHPFVRATPAVGV